MNALQAKAIIKKYRLIPGKISRIILSAIIEDRAHDNTEFNKYISYEQYENLKKLYVKYLSKHPEKKSRYAVFYHILEDIYPTFSSTKIPRVENLRVSLLSLMLRKVDLAKDQTLSRKYPALYQFSAKTIQALNEFIENTCALSMDKFEMDLLINWLKKALKNEPVTIFIPICPDYAVEASNNPKFRVMHTFTTVGDKLGPVAQKILETLPALHKLLTALNISPKIISGMADFEAFSKEGLKRVGLSEAEFLLNAEKSARLFEKESGIDTVMITSLVGGKKEWNKKLSLVSTKINKGDYGNARINNDYLLNAAKKRKDLFSRWYGQKESLTDYIPTVLNQGTEYATMGEIFHDTFPNCLIMGADSDAFIEFYRFSHKLPVIYFKKIYY